jgi:error-prone DNA polymerase
LRLVIAMKSPKANNPLHQSQENSDDGVFLPEPSLFSEIAADYSATGLSLRPHILSLLREEAPYSGCTPAAELGKLSMGRFVRVAGLVTGRQRPGTAKGTVFVTLEDETGNINLVVWSKVQQNFRSELMTAKLLLVKGRVETEQSVTHVIAGSLEDRTQDIEALSLKSRDFH